MDRIAFSKNKLPYGWCSNMSAYPIEYNGKTWRTTEALFQALRFSDENIQEEIRESKSPMSAKLIAKSKPEQMIVEQLSEKDLENMKLCVRLKAEQHPELLKELLLTKDAIITEDCTSRGRKGSNLFWGAILEDGEWIGENHLGRIWMDLREEFKLQHERN